MKARGHRLAVVSLRRWADGYENVTTFGLTDVPVLQVRYPRGGDLQLVKDTAGMVASRSMRGRPPRGWGQMRSELGLRQGTHEWVWSKRISAFARQHGTDVVDAHWMSEAAQAARTLRLTEGTPFSVTCHGGDLGTPGLGPISEAAAKVCPVSRYLARQLVEGWVDPFYPFKPLDNVVPSDKVRVRHHGLPGKTIASEPASSGSAELTIAMTGRLDPQKRPIDLVEALGRLHSEFPRVRVVMIGGGVLEPEIRSRAKELGVIDRLTITGGLPWKDVIATLRQADLYVQPSQWEGFGVAALEAASQGLPTVLTDTGAHADIAVEGKTGHVYQPGDIDTLTQRLRELLLDADLRRTMGLAALTHVREQFVFEDLMPGVEEMLETIAGVTVHAR